MNCDQTIDAGDVVLRRFKENDWRDLHEYLSDARVLRYEPYEPFSAEKCREEAARRSEDEAFWAVCLKETGKLIGNLYFAGRGFGTYELGYVFSRMFWRKGYATRAARALMEHAFCEMGVHRMVARCNPENEASWRLLERLGMRREGHLIQSVYFKTDPQGKPVWHDTYLYAILASEWKRKSESA